MKKYILILLIIFTFYGCQKEKQYELTQIDTYSFRRNYFEADILTGKDLEKFMNRNPVVDHADVQKESAFFSYFVKAKIIDNYTWNLSKFDTLPDKFMYHLAQKEIATTIDFKYLEKENTNNYILTFKDGKHTILKDTLTFEFPPDVIFSTMDLNKNGTDELYTLYKNYAMNGDNFELNIYEMKQK